MSYINNQHRRRVRRTINNNSSHPHQSMKYSTSNPLLQKLLFGVVTMTMSVAIVSAKRAAFQLVRGRSMMGIASRAQSVAFTTSSWAQDAQLPSIAPSLPLPFTLQSTTPIVSSSALHMAGRSTNTKPRSGGSRANSSNNAAVASPMQKATDEPTDDADAPKQNSNQTKKDNNNTKKKKKKKGANTGRLRLLPPLQPSTEILSRAQRLTYHEVKDDTKIANQRRRTQKRGAQTIDSLSQKLCAPLKSTVQTYKWELRNMHPFEKVVMELTIRARQKKDGLTLSQVLDEIHEGRKEILQLSKDWIAKIKTSDSAREAFEYTEEAKEQIGNVFLDLIQEPWTGIQELQRSLRNVPVVRLDQPAVVLVGAPNVGKSSIVRAISSGTPEVNNYPFTTRGMTVGHVQVFWESDEDVALGNVAGVSVPSERDVVQEKLSSRGVVTRRMKEQEAVEEFAREKAEYEKEFGEDADISDDVMEEEEGAALFGDSPSDTSAFIETSGENQGMHWQVDKPKVRMSRKIFPISQLCQIMDSPGLLRRDEIEIRNEMEELTLAAMSHLPTSVMYVMDLSGGAGDKCSSVEDQLVLRRELRARFPRRPWIDVISKFDLGVVDGARERLIQIMEAEKKQRGGDDDDHYFLELSIKEGQGVDELRQEVMRMLGEVRVVLDAMAAMDERSARAV